MMDIDSMIAVLQAAKAGKQIEYRTRRSTNGSTDPWAITHSITERGWFDSQVFDYRVKPEPREWWVNVYDGMPEGFVHPTKEDAEHWKSQSSGTRKEVVRVREVLE
jgi:hypothetical protein